MELKTDSPQVYSDFLFNKLFSDVAIDYTNDNGEVVSVPAHKIILAASSEWFDALFHSSIDVVDARDIEDFKDVLTWLYKFTLPSGGYNKPSIINNADFLRIGNLEQRIMKNVDIYTRVHHGYIT